MFGILNFPQAQTPFRISPPTSSINHGPRRCFKRRPHPTFSTFSIPFFTTTSAAAAASSSAIQFSNSPSSHFIILFNPPPLLLFPSSTTTNNNNNNNNKKGPLITAAAAETSASADGDNKDENTLPLLPLPVSDAKKKKKPLPSAAAAAALCLLVAVFSYSPFRLPGTPPAAAMAALVTATTTEVTRKKTIPSTTTSRPQQGIQHDKKPHHMYSHSTQRLLDIVSQRLLTTIEDVKNGKDTVHSVEEALKDVKFKKNELQDEILTGLYADLRVFRAEKTLLLKRSEDILDGVFNLQREEDILGRSNNNNRAGDLRDKIVKLEEEMKNGETQYNEIWDRIAEIDDQILRRETMALSIGVRELLFIERECEHLVQRFLSDMRRTNAER